MFKKNKKNTEEQNIEKKYDFVILGAGLTGLTLAKYLVKKEFDVLVVDKDEPGIKDSLDLKNFAKIIRRQKEKNVLPEVFMESMPSRLAHIRETQNKELLSSLEKETNYKFIKGEIKELADFSINVNDEEFHFKKLVFACGSIYEDSSYPNLKREMYINLNEISKTNKFYNNVAIYGTNIQALELADAFATAGSEVHLFDKNVNLFDDFDDDLEAILTKSLNPSKIHWHLESEIKNHKFVSDSVTRIEFSNQGIDKFIEVDLIILTDNKRPNTDNLNPKYDLPLNSRGAIIIDNFFKVKLNPNFYAIGDVNGISPGANQGKQQALILSQYLSGNKKAKFNASNSTFTIDSNPQIAFHGSNKHELDALSIKYNEFIYDFDYELNSKLLAHQGRLKVLTNEKHEILGVFLYGQKVKELLPLFIMMKNAKIKFYKLANLNYPFYSKSEFLIDAAIDYENEYVGFSKKLQKIKKANSKKKAK